MLLASLVFCSLLFISSIVFSATSSQGAVRAVYAVAAFIQAGCVAVDVYLLVGGL